MVLRGANNRKLLRQLQDLSPNAQIIVNAEKLSEAESLYAAGASYVSAPRLLEANELLRAIEAADSSLLGEKRADQLKALEKRDEVIP